LIAIQILFVQGLPPRFVLVLMQKNLLLYRDVSVWLINCALDRNKKSNHRVPVFGAKHRFSQKINLIAIHRG